MHVIDRLLRITGRLLSKSDRRYCVFIKVIAFFLVWENWEMKFGQVSKCHILDQKVMSLGQEFLST